MALIKYWGKRDTQLMLPLADSVSVCLSDSRTTVHLDWTNGDERILWCGEPLAAQHTEPFCRVLEAVRRRSGLRKPVFASISTTLPPRVGLAGSAAALAAFALAATTHHGLTLDREALSALARIGSGSACRSVPDGFCRWHRGDHPQGSDSFARSVAPPDHWPQLRIISVLLDSTPKTVSSTHGMAHVVATSPDLPRWVDRCNAEAPRAVAAIQARDFTALATLAADNAMAMHALCLTARPPILYLQAAAIDLVRNAASTLDFPHFATFDAGPNPIFFTLAPHHEKLARWLSNHLPNATIRHHLPTTGARLEPLCDKTAP